MAKDDDMSLEDMLSQLGNSLIKQAVEPDMSRYKPHEKQLEFHKSQAYGRVFLGGNRSGKTVGGIIEDLWWVTRRHPYRRIPSDVAIRGRVLGDGFDNGTVNQVLIPTMQRWILPSDLKNGSWEDSYSRGDHKLTLENGSFIEFKSYDQPIQKHAGTSRHFIHFDEEVPNSIFIESMLRLVDTSGSWWMTMTPLNGMNWVYDEIYAPWKENKLNKNDIFIVEVNTTDNPFVDGESLERALQLGDKEDIEQRTEGKFAEKGGLVFPEFSEQNLMKSKGWLPPRGWRVYMSLDHGLNNPTAALWHAVSPDNYVVTFREHYMSQMLVEEHAVVMHQIERDNGLEVFARPGDPAMKQRNAVTGTSIVQEYAEHGIFLAVDNIPRAVATGLDRMRKYMKPGPVDKNGIPARPRWIIIEDECPNLVRELKRLHYETYSSEKLNDGLNRKETIHKKDDHAFDSSRYFFTMMPDLAPEALWHLMPVERKPKTYIETLVDMQRYELNAFDNKPRSSFARDFTEEEYSMAGLEVD